MTKGQLEITIFEARNLNKLLNFVKGKINLSITTIRLFGQFSKKAFITEDTYIKTYLRTGHNKLHKKKTHVVKNTPHPVFNTKLSYKACNVLGRRIQVVSRINCFIEFL